MTRSVALLDSLSQEKERWDEGSEGFKQQMSTILSDCLVSAAFLAYAGYYDQHMRESLFTSWLSHLHSAKLKYRDDIARIEVGAVLNNRGKIFIMDFYYGFSSRFPL